MGLFSTLLNASNASEAVSSEGTGAGSTSGSSKAPSDLPTVIQLFSKYPIPIAVVDTAALATEILEATGGKKHNQNQQQQKRKTLVNSRHSLFAPLHYFAVQCKDPNQFSDLDSSQSAFMSGGLRKNALALKNMDTKLLTPDLGIWNCRADGSAVSDALLPMATSKAAGGLPLFCLVVDLSLPLGTVETTITTIQQALVRYLIQHYQSTSTTAQPSDGLTSEAATTASTSTTATTSQYLLQTVQFGLADKDEKGNATAASQLATVDEATKNVKIALQICVMSSPNRSNQADEPGKDDNASTSDYKTQQHVQLLTYHLRKYASALNASLVFVEVGAGAGTASSTEPTAAAGSDPGKTGAHVFLEQPTVSTWELPIVWRSLASGIPVWKYDNVDAMQAGAAPPEENVLLEPTEGSTATPGEEPTDEAAVVGVLPPSSGYSLVYGPDNHNPELIETVLLRNASFPGQWDATKDSVWKILPAPDNTKSIGSASANKTASIMLEDGDQGWLKELRDSVAPADSGLQTPDAKGKQPSADASTATKTPNDQGVSSFFEDLLKS